MVETAYSSIVCSLVLAGLGCGIVDPVTAIGYLERGLILKRLEPSVHFRTLLLFPPKKKSRLAVQMTDCLMRQKINLDLAVPGEAVAREPR